MAGFSRALPLAVAMTACRELPVSLKRRHTVV